MYTPEKVYRPKEYEGKYLDVYNMREAVKHATTVTVEFGTANTPLYQVSPIGFNEDNLYVGVNFDPAQHEFLRNDVGIVDGYATLATVGESGDIKSHLPDESTDRVVMANVFGEPDSAHIGLGDMFPDENDRYAGHSALGSKTKTLHEALRVLKPDGKILILETNTPYRERNNRVIGEKPEPNYASMARLLEVNGYVVDSAIDVRDKDWSDIVSQLAVPARWWDDRGSYLVVASKAEVTLASTE